MKTNPPPGAKVSIRRRTSSRTSCGVPNGSVFCVFTPPPQNTSRLPNLRFSSAGSIPRAEHCTGLRMSKPASTIGSSSGSMPPQQCMNVFHGVWEWIHPFTRCWYGR